MLPLLAGAPAAAQTLERIREAGQINLGHRSDARPFSYWNDAQQPTGYSVDLCRKVADAVKTELGLPNLKVELVTVGLCTAGRACRGAGLPGDGRRTHGRGDRFCKPAPSQPRPPWTSRCAT